jgi:phosphatidylglycerophosphate synthase
MMPLLLVWSEVVIAPITVVLLILAYEVVMDILVPIWVYKDAKKRGMEAFWWMLFVFLFDFLGLIVYLLVRPSTKIQSQSINIAGSKWLEQAT